MLSRLNESTSLVVAGAWNPDILSPAWVAKEALALQLGQNFPVNVQLPIGNPTQRPVFEFEGIRYLSAKGALTFYLKPEDTDQVNKSITAVTRILDLLSHTPVTGFGFNSSYEITTPSIALLETFSSGQILTPLVEDVGAQTVVQSWKSSIKTQDHLLNVEAELVGGKIQLDFNVHFEVNSASSASQRLKTVNLFSDTDSIINKIALHLHGLGEQT